MSVHAVKKREHWFCSQIRTDSIFSYPLQPNACLLFLLIVFLILHHPYGTRKSFCLSNIKHPLCFSTAMYTMLMKRSKQMMDCSLTAKATSLSLVLERERWGNKRDIICNGMQSVAAERGVKHKLGWFQAAQMGQCHSIHTNTWSLRWTSFIESFNGTTVQAGNLASPQI